MVQLQKSIINEVVSVNLIKPHQRNYKEHPERQIQQLKLSHQRFGQYRSVVLWSRPNGEYIQVAGHGIVEAMKLDGITEIRADILPEDTPESEIEAILVADNLHAENSIDNEFALSELLKEQKESHFDLQSIGYSEEALDALLEKLRPPSFEEIAEQYGEETKEEDFWPVIRLKVPPEVKAKFDDFMDGAEGNDDSERFAFLLSLLEREEIAVEEQK